jgi:hypothetical protein
MIINTSIKAKWKNLKAQFQLKFDMLTGYGMSFESARTDKMYEDLYLELDTTIKELKKNIAAL